MYEIIEILPEAKSIVDVIKIIIKYLDNNNVVKILKEVGLAQTKAALESLSEAKYLSNPDEAFDSALTNLQSAHQMLYKARVEASNRFSISSLCEADYFVCCLIAQLYFEKKRDKCLIEKYLLLAFYARENNVFSYRKRKIIESVGLLNHDTFVKFHWTKKPCDYIHSSSRENFMKFSRELIGNSNFLKTDLLGEVYCFEDKQKWSSALQEECQAAVIGTSSIRIRFSKIVIKVDACTRYTKYAIFSSYRLYLPKCINKDEIITIISANIIDKLLQSYKHIFRDILKFQISEIDKIYTIIQGSKKAAEKLSTNFFYIKQNLIDLNKTIDKIEIKTDGIYLWTKEIQIDAVPWWTIEKYLSNINKLLNKKLFELFEKLNFIYN